MLIKKFTRFTAAVALLIGSASLVFSAQARVNEPAPDFTLTDSHGNSHSLSDFRGQFVVLEWINHGCPFVVKFYRPGKMQEWQKKYAAKDVVWLSICSSAEGTQGYMTPDQINAKNAEIGAAPAAYLIDEDGTVGRLYGARRTPEMFIINPEGVLIYHGAIDSIRSTNSDDIAKAENYVINALREAKAGEAVTTQTTQPYGCTVKYR